MSFIDVLELLHDTLSGTVKTLEPIVILEEKTGKPFDKAFEDIPRSEEFWTQVPPEVIGRFFTIFARFYSLSLKLPNFMSLNVEEKRKIIEDLKSLERELQEFAVQVKSMVAQQ